MNYLSVPKLLDSWCKHDTMIYFDNNATTFMPPCVKEVMQKFFVQGNPSSNYDLAHKCDKIIKYAQNYLLSICNAKSHKVIFTSGASESNATVIKGLSKMSARPHYIIGATEHKSVLSSVEQLAESGEITYTKIYPINGNITSQEVIAKILPETTLISLMWANNETGIITDVNTIFAKVKEIRPDIICHSDSVQYFGKYFINMEESSCDIITLSFHKLHGPTNCGAIIFKNNVILRPLIPGSQYDGYRGGTQNISLIAGSLEGIYYTLKDRSYKNGQLSNYRDIILHKLSIFKVVNMSTFKDDEAGNYIFLHNSNDTKLMPHVLMMSIVCVIPPYTYSCCNIMLQQYLYKKFNIIVSTGSACNKTSPSYVLEAMKVDKILRSGAIRISFGDSNTPKEVNTFATHLFNICNKFYTQCADNHKQQKK